MNKDKANRIQRWNDAITRAEEALGSLKGLEVLSDAASDLVSIQEEYQEWLDNMPENLLESPTTDKLEEVTQIDLSRLEEIAQELADMLQEAEDIISEASACDLPRGFGRD